jgi:hypothetical protein
MTEPNTAADALSEREAEYGRYRANQVINIDGVRAFNAGDPVPVSHVTRKIVTKDLVDDVSVKKG